MRLLADLLEICTDAGLITVADADYLAARHERQFDHPIRLLIGPELDGAALYRVLAERSGLEFWPTLPEVVPPADGWPLSQDDFGASEALPVGFKDDTLMVASWRWDHRVVIPAVLAARRGGPVRLILVTPEVYDGAAKHTSD